MLALRDLGACFLRHEIRPCHAGANECSVTSPHTTHEFWVPVAHIEAADGVKFLCPKCWLAHGGPIGTHSVVCWRPRVPLEVRPGPGRWEFHGSSLDDLTLVAGSSSIRLHGGCGAHLHVVRGTITDLT